MKQVSQSFQHPLLKTLNPTWTKTIQEKLFPIVYSPKNISLSPLQLAQIFRTHKSQILSLLQSQGAIYFKGFDIKSPEEFSTILTQLNLNPFKYDKGIIERNLVVGSDTQLDELQVFTIEQSPPSENISHRNQLAYTDNFPCTISFYCQHFDCEGGETSIVRGDIVYDWLQKNDPQFLKALSQGVIYKKVLEEEDDLNNVLGRGWKSIFNVKTKEECQIYIQLKGWQCEWLENNKLQIKTNIISAVRQLDCGKKSFFNQILLTYQKNNFIKDFDIVTFADGSSLPQKSILQLKKFYQQNQVLIQWMNGDFILIENKMVSYTHKAYKNGKRQLFSIFGKGIYESNRPITLALNNGRHIPIYGLGLWKLEPQKCIKVINQAIKIGYRHLDGASVYANEKQVGAAIKMALQNNLVKREQLFVTSKLWNTYHKKQAVKIAIKKTLEDLQLDYLDLYLIHFPISLKFIPIQERYPTEWFYDPNAKYPCLIQEPVPLSQTWAAMQQLVEQGLVKSIGLSNFNIQIIRDLLSYAKIKPSVLQVQLHPFNSQEKLVRFCRQKGIVLEAYSSFGGLSYIDQGFATKDQNIFNLNVIKQIAEKKNKTPAQVALRWAIQQNIVVIPKSSSDERLKENQQLFDWRLQDDEMKLIQKVDIKRRFNDPGYYALNVFNTFYPIYE